MRKRIALVVLASLLFTSGCAQCALQSLLFFMPNAYSGVGGDSASKSADLDERIQESQNLKDLYSN